MRHSKDHKLSKEREQRDICLSWSGFVGEKFTKILNLRTTLTQDYYFNMYYLCGLARSKLWNLFKMVPLYLRFRVEANANLLSLGLWGILKKKLFVNLQTVAAKEEGKWAASSASQQKLWPVELLESQDLQIMEL